MDENLLKQNIAMEQLKKICPNSLPWIKKILRLKAFIKENHWSESQELQKLVSRWQKEINGSWKLQGKKNQRKYNKNKVDIARTQKKIDFMENI